MLPSGIDPTSRSQLTENEINSGDINVIFGSLVMIVNNENGLLCTAGYIGNRIALTTAKCACRSNEAILGVALVTTVLELESVEVDYVSTLVQEEELAVLCLHVSSLYSIVPSILDC